MMTTKGKQFPLREKFMSKIMHHPWTDCWLWTGARTDKGYGRIRTIRTGRNRCELAHRISYELFVALPPSDLVVCHCCDNPICVNPAHLFLGTQQDNVKDAVAKHRFFKPDNSGGNNGQAKLTKEDVIAIKKRLLAESHIRGTNARICEQYGITCATVTCIKKGRLWGWLTIPQSESQSS